MRMKVLAFGEVLWDIYEDDKYIGGAPLNFAAHFKKCGGESWLITAVGYDFLGNETVENIEKMGVNTEYVTYNDRETGKCLVTLDDNQIPAYNLLDNVAYDFIEEPDLNSDYDVLYFGTLALRHEYNRDVLKRILSDNKFEDVFVDINIRPPYYSKEIIKFACNNATILKISDEELPMVRELLEKSVSSIENTAKNLCEEFRNLKIVIITRGEKGSFVYNSVSQETFECDASKVNVVSTVGAGDSFSASFLAEYLKTEDIMHALNFATRISGYVVSQKDAVPEYDIHAE